MSSTSNQTGANRRRYKRYPAEIAVLILTTDGDELCTGTIANISDGGFFVAINHMGINDLSQTVVRHFQRGERLEFRLPLAMEPSHLDVSGTVRWYSETFEQGRPCIKGCGIQLHRLTVEQRRVWQYLVKSFLMRHPNRPVFSTKLK